MGEGWCEDCEALYDAPRCPGCPTDEQFIATGNFYKLAYRVLVEHRDGGEATKAHELGQMMKKCYEAGRARAPRRRSSLGLRAR